MPIMFDESLCSRVDAEHIIAEGLGDLFNLRLSKCGGFLATLRLAQLARRHGLGYQLGCQVGETAILSAAGRHFATSVAGLRWLEGSYDRHLVREALGRVDLTFRRGGAPRAAGAGTGDRSGSRGAKAGNAAGGARSLERFSPHRASGTMKPPAGLSDREPGASQVQGKR